MPDNIRLVVPDRVEAQLFEIVERVASDNGILVAERIFNDLRTAIDTLIEMPERHPSRDHVRKHYRCAIVSRWSIYYRYVAGSDVIEVVALLDQAMDVERHLPTD